MSKVANRFFIMLDTHQLVRLYLIQEKDLFPILDLVDMRLEILTATELLQSIKQIGVEAFPQILYDDYIFGGHIEGVAISDEIAMSTIPDEYRRRQRFRYSIYSFSESYLAGSMLRSFRKSEFGIESTDLSFEHEINGFTVEINRDVYTFRISDGMNLYLNDNRISKCFKSRHVYNSGPQLCLLSACFVSKDIVRLWLGISDGKTAGSVSELYDCFVIYISTVSNSICHIGITYIGGKPFTLNSVVSKLHYFSYKDDAYYDYYFDVNEDDVKRLYTFKTKCLLALGKEKTDLLLPAV